MTPLIYEREFNLPRGHATGFGGSPLSAMLGRPRERNASDRPNPNATMSANATIDESRSMPCLRLTAREIIKETNAGSNYKYGESMEGGNIARWIFRPRIAFFC